MSDESDAHDVPPNEPATADGHDDAGSAAVETRSSKADPAISADPELAEDAPSPEPAEDAPATDEGASAAEDGSGGGDDDAAAADATADAADESTEPEPAVSSLGDLYDQWAAGALPPAKVQALARAPREPVSGLRWWQHIERVRGIETHEPPRPMPKFFVVTSASDAATVAMVELDGGESDDGGAANDENAPPPPPPPSLAALYDRWAAGKLDAATEARLANAPREPGSTLRWWQWVERHRGVELHDPPRAVPRFQSEIDEDEPTPSPSAYFSRKCPLGPAVDRRPDESNNDCPSLLCST